MPRAGIVLLRLHLALPRTRRDEHRPAHPDGRARHLHRLRHLPASLSRARERRAHVAAPNTQATRPARHVSHPIPDSPEDNQPPKLPDLNQATLDWPGVETLLRDIEACTEITEIISKFAAQGYVPEADTVTLADARRMLSGRSVRGLQIRYRYEGAEWWDTLMVVGQEYRLVRIRHDFGQGTGA